MESEKGRYKIVKEMSNGTWYFIIMKKKSFGWRYVRCYGSNRDIDLSLTSDTYNIKRFLTEKDAEEAVMNIQYKKEIDLK